MRSHLPGITWPAVPDAPTAMLLALQWQLEQSQWWPAARLAAEQARQLAPLLAHARETTLHHAELPATWADVPVQTRHDLIAAGPRLLSKRYPAAHGNAPETFSSRTTGEPVRVRVPEILTTFWNAITLRDHLWHRRDLGAHLAAIRHTGAGTAAAPDGVRGSGWGPATAALAPDAPLSLLSIDAGTDDQVAWLVRTDPVYLLVYPTVLGAICRQLAATGQRLPSLRQVRTISEALSPDTRALCAEVLGVPLVDTYSAQEVGYIALQCPDHPRYHVQAERLLVEILDEDGRACAPGEIGRVVVTDLHNFATPLIRYDLGDLAEVGEPCPCGRGLPALERIIGRRRGMLVHADGRTTWPVFTVACRAAAPYRELQLVQETVERLRLRVVPLPGTPITEAQRDALAAAIRGALGAFTVEVDLVERLDRSPAGKLEEFVSHVATSWRAPPAG